MREAKPEAEPEAAPAVSAAIQPRTSVEPAQESSDGTARGSAADAAGQAPAEPEESFADALSAFERAHTHRADSGAKQGAKQLEGTVVSLTADLVFLDIGYKVEGVLPRSAFPNNGDAVKRGDRVSVSITGRNEEGYYQLSRFRVAQPRDWSALEGAFTQKLAIAGTVTAAVKGGLSVDVGVRAFMPLSRSGARDAAEVEALIGQQITCRITKLDVADENVVVDRRVVLEEQARGEMEARRAALDEGATITGTVRTLMPYGAFVDIGGVDGLLHISDMAHARVAKPADVVSVGQQIQVRILKVDPASGKISLGLKQLQPEPWQTVPERYQQGQRVSGAVTRVTDFGAFVELEPGVEGMIHISEMSWAKKVRHPSDLLKPGDRVDAVILSIKPPTQSEAGRIALGLKQTLVDPWLEAQRKFPVGSQVQGPVTKIMNFGAFVEVAEGVEGLVHISEIVADRRLNHPRDVLHAGQVVKAMVLAIDLEKHQMKLSIKQAVPTSLDEYIAEHKPGDQVSGRVVEIAGDRAVIELGEGIRAICRISASASEAEPAPASPSTPAKADLSSLTSMLQARWKGAGAGESAQPERLGEGQVRSFRIVKLEAEAKKIEVDFFEK
ncbi:MAG: S1 RNA-binding domain-containing protein [Terracidiphilus sp.]